MRSAAGLLIALSLSTLACHTTKKTPATDSEGIIIIQTNGAKEKAPDAIQIKYGKLLGVAPETITNAKLYRFVDEWLNTPYKWGGTDKRGIDCSAFVQRLLSEVYAVNIPRTSEQQFLNNLVDRFKLNTYAHEGDLVFFTFKKDKIISHVGLYLANNKFVNSCNQGVIIADLTNPYWKRNYVGAGRFKTGPAK